MLKIAKNRLDRLEDALVRAFQRGTDRLPVLFLLYVAITALTRFLAIDVTDLLVERVLVVTGSMFVLTLAALAVQIAASRFAVAPEDGTQGA